MIKSLISLAFLLGIHQAAFCQQKVNQNTTSVPPVKEQQENPTVSKTTGNAVLPLPATEYTDPNYQLNKTLSEQVNKNLEAFPDPGPTKQEMITYLEKQIELMKKGAISNEKLEAYEAELFSLKNNR